jgi:hypothetical protein
MKDLFCIGPDNVLTVRLVAVMPWLVALCDGLPVVFWGRSKKPYLKVIDAVAWCKKEITDREASGVSIAKDHDLRVTLEVLERALREYPPTEAGNAI